MRPKTRHYRKVEKLIAKLVGRFCRTCNLEYDEAWGVACLAFCEASLKHDGRIRFANWCAWIVEKRLTDLVRDEARRREYTGWWLADRRSKTFDLGSLLWRLDADGIETVMLVLDPPGLVRYRVKKDGGSYSAFRRAVKERLKDQGWSKTRIWKTFRRVRSQL